MWSRNTVRESSHISFFCGRHTLRVLERRPQNTHWEADRFLEITSGSPSQSKIKDLILSFNSHVVIWTHLFAHVIYVYGWLSELTYSRFSPVICWSYLRTEISVILYTFNKWYSSASSFIFLIPVKPLLMLSCDRIESAKFIHETLSPAKLVYYTHAQEMLRRIQT